MWLLGGPTVVYQWFVGETVGGPGVAMGLQRFAVTSTVRCPC